MAFEKMALNKNELKNLQLNGLLSIHHIKISWNSLELLLLYGILNYTPFISTGVNFVR